jgi:hypothetical protein
MVDAVVSVINCQNLLAIKSRQQMSYLFAEARNCRFSGIGAQSLPFGSRKKASLPDGQGSGATSLVSHPHSSAAARGADFR